MTTEEEPQLQTLEPEHTSNNEVAKLERPLEFGATIAISFISLFTVLLVVLAVLHAKSRPYGESISSLRVLADLTQPRSADDLKISNCTEFGHQVSSHSNCYPHRTNVDLDQQTAVRPSTIGADARIRSTCITVNIAQVWFSAASADVVQSIPSWPSTSCGCLWHEPSGELTRNVVCRALL